jgi:hypothetical protein
MVEETARPKMFRCIAGMAGKLVAAPTFMAAVVGAASLSVFFRVVFD